jgi:hypothetical protein
MIRPTIALVSATALLVLPGCLVSSSSRTETTGKNLESADTRSIEVGKTTGDEIIQSFGAPTERTDRPDGSATWKYCQIETRRSSGAVFLVFGGSSSKSTKQCTVLDLKGGVVTAVRSE